MGGQLISDEALDEMTTVFPHGDDYGLGILRLNWDSCGRVWGHDGLFFGYYTFAGSSRDGSRQAVVTINVDTRSGVPPPSVFAEAYTGLYKAYCGLAGPAPTDATPWITDEFEMPAFRDAADAQPAGPSRG